MVAEEFWALLSPEDQSRMRENQRRYREAGEGLFSDLERLSFRVETLSDLRAPGVQAASAIETLLDWYLKVEYVPLRHDIISTLGERWAKPALADLVRLFVSAPQADADGGLREGLASSICRNASESVFDDLVSIAKDSRYGSDRGLIIVAIGKIRTKRAATLPIVVGLLDDPEVNVIAAEVLGRYGDASALERLRVAETHPNNYFRSAAKSAAHKITRRGARSSIEQPTTASSSASE